MPEKALILLRNLVVGLLVAALLAAIALPVYSDEVGWRFQERAAIDGVDKMFSEVCGLNTLAAPPFFMMPVRYYSAAFNLLFDAPLFIRLSGILYALIFVALMIGLVRRLVEGRGPRAALLLIGAGLAGLGVLPLMLVLSRPEQPIVLAALGALLLAFPARSGDDGEADAPTGTLRAWLRSAAVLALAIIAISYHFKGVVLTPLFLACLFFASRGRSAHLPRIVMALAIVAATLSATHYWRDRVLCADPIVGAAYGAHNLAGQMVEGGSPLRLIPAMIGNVSLTGYVRLATPAANPMSQWLPAGQLSREATWIWFRLLSAAWLLAALASIGCILLAAVDAVRRRRLDARLVLSVLTFGIAMLWSASQVIRNDYEAAFVLPLSILGFLIALAAPAGARHRRPVALLGALLGLGAIVSIVAVTAIFGPALVCSSQQDGYIAEQRFSVAPFAYWRLKPDIVGAARQCGIGARPKALLIDDITYFTFIRGQLPQHYLGVVSVWSGTISDPIAYLRGRGSEGAVLGCHFLPEDLRRQARRQGRFCCLSAADW